MKKRVHLFIDQWLYDYLEQIAEGYGVSVSLVLRSHIARSVICSAREFGMKPDIDPCNVLKEYIATSKKPKKDRIRFLENIVYEGHKAIDWRIRNNKMVIAKKPSKTH